MSFFQRRPKYGPTVLKKRLGWTWVRVRPSARGTAGVYLSMFTGPAGCEADFTQDEARILAQALLDAIEQSKALTAQKSD